jgi:dTDP-4-dehydrorhamnose 3,5-epimerase
MIDGVKIKKLITHADDRGYFREVLRVDEDIMSNIRQTSVTMTYPGVIKAFHWHEKQDDFWYVHEGMVRVALYDRRPDSPTMGEKQQIVIGESSPAGVRIPKGVAHGYQVLGTKPIMLFYHTTECYNPESPDEGRIDWNDPAIGFDWSVQNR